MKTLYLHIGTPKTATSSIQKFLDENKEVLEKYGYCYPESVYRYPKVNIRRNGHFLVDKIVNEDGKRDKEQEKIYLEKGFEQIEDCFQRFDNVIISDEAVWHSSSYFRKNIFAILKKKADEQGYQIKIIVYLRRQDQFLLSRWNQSVKQNFSYAAKMTCEEYFFKVRKKEKKIFEYATKLDEISDYFGKENIIVRRFQKDSWKDGSIIHDFMHEIGLEVTEEFKELEKEANLRLNKNTTEIKRIINQNMEFTEKEISYLGKFLKIISENSIEEKPSSMLSKEETQNFLSEYEQENLRVSEEYCKDGKPLFSSEINDVPKWSPQNDEMYIDMIRFFTTATIQLHRENLKQDEEIKYLKSELKRLEKQSNSLEKKVEKIDQTSKIFRDKVRHPFRTLRGRFFRLIQGKHNYGEKK